MACSSCGSHAPPPAPVRVEATQGAEPSGPDLSQATVIKLADMRAKPADYAWFQFKPGVKKLILSGTPDSRHVSVLWYGYEGQAGSVPLHYHAQTESIFVIDGAQTDAKGTYGKGSFYFNPPGSGHDISNSSGLFCCPTPRRQTSSARPTLGLTTTWWSRPTTVS
jgi:anti-sigma factor ChrR (cupin superfamily)